MKIRYAGYIPNSMENGEGIRDVIFFSGCSRNCLGCHNKEMQNFKFGEDVEIEDIVSLVKKNKGLIDGVTISGGDPIFQYEGLLELCKRLKEEGFNIWVYTGGGYLEILKKHGLELFKCIDVMVDNPFDEKLTEPKAKYRGSWNQNILHFDEIGLLYSME